MREQKLKVGDKVKAIQFVGRDVTIGKVYSVLAGPGDENIGMVAHIINGGALRPGCFNFRDDVGDVRHTRLHGVFDTWEVLPNE